jgi:L-malate glycosyltransferase
MTGNQVNKPVVIVHVTPHLGGGVGKVLLNYLRSVKRNASYLHKVICLDYANEKAVAEARETGFQLFEKMGSDHTGILREIAAADIVIVHWWNHPLLYDFLVRESIPPARIIFWSHISGFHPPYVFTKALLEYPDIMALTTPASLESPEIVQMRDELKDDIRIIWSTGGISEVVNIVPRAHKGVVVGYVGTVDYAKMHPAFIRMSASVNIQDVRFVICGGPNEKNLADEARSLGAEDRFIFTGQIDNVPEYMSGFDIFGYALSPYHYGTCEQALCEAMAASVAPVVFSNRAEMQIVRHGINGLVADNEAEYIAAIECLGINENLRIRLSANARETARSLFGMEIMIEKWDKVFEDVLQMYKRPRQWKGLYSGEKVETVQVFLESLGSYGEAFSRSYQAKSERASSDAIEKIRDLFTSSEIWHASTRGTPNHYNKFFPDDKYIRLWQGLVKNNAVIPGEG